MEDSAACQSTSPTGSEMLISQVWVLSFCSLGVRPYLEEICLYTVQESRRLWNKTTVVSVSAESAVCLQGCAARSLCQEQWRVVAPIAVQVEAHRGGDSWKPRNQSDRGWWQGLSLETKSSPVRRTKSDATAESLKHERSLAKEGQRHIAVVGLLPLWAFLLSQGACP